MDQEQHEQDQLPEYIPPEVTTYTEEEILDELGPAQTLTSTMGNNPFGFP